MYLCSELVVRSVYMNLPDGHFLQESKYQLTNTIGQGGFGITYLGVWNTEVKGELGKIKTKVPVCIKEYFFKDYCYRDKDSHAVKVHSETGEKLFGKFKEKLIKEANILSAVHHPYIVNVLEVFEENNTAYIIMEYIKGCSLKYMLDKEGVLPENKVLKYTHQIGNALDFVHEKNIVHLDIKPGNILIDRDDNARLIDFGVSKRYDIQEQETSTTTLTLSKGFASIEQYDDEGTQSFSPCPDIYSLGATMYNLLTGVVPVESILRATKKMLPPSAYNSNITSKTEKAILYAMEVKPEERYQLVKELLAAIDIPPYELSENTLTETNQSIEDDSTEVLGNRLSSVENSDDDDLTIVKSPTAGQNVPENKNPENKTKRRVLLLTGILFCAFIGYAVYSYFFNIPFSSNGTQTGIDMPGDSAKQELITSGDNTSSENQTDSVNTQQTTTQNQTPSIQTKTQNTNNANNPVETGSSKGNANELTASEIAEYEKQYNTLITSAKEKMEHGNFYQCRLDLEKAKAIIKKANLLESMYAVDKLLDQCSEKEKQQQIKKRLENYEKYPNFGSLTLVRHNKTKLYGAINEEGSEIIPCKYETINQTSKGIPEFQLKGGLIDIYDGDGKLIRSGEKPSN